MPKTMSIAPTGIDRPAAPLTVSHQGDTARLEWLHSLLWCAVFGDELSQTTSEDYTNTIAAVYAEKPPQVAAQVTFAGSANSDQFPTIRRLAEVSDEGLSRIQPGDSRGRERGLVIVSDSTTVFMAGKRTFCDLAPDFKELRSGNGILSHYHYLEYAPIWGAALPSIVDKAHELVGAIAQQSSRPQALAVDIIIVWMGNELVGRRGVFVDPNVPKWNQTAENMQATGIWESVASKVCGQIQRLAALKGRPCVNSVQLLGDAYPGDYKLPPEYRDAVRMFFAYARGRGLKTGSLDVAVSAIPKYDGYHFREDRTHRSAFTNVLAQRARCIQAEATLSSLTEEHLRFLQDTYPYDRYGERVYRMKHVFDRALFNAQHSRRLLRQAEIQQSTEDCPDPWETEWIAPPEEPVTGLREVELPADMQNWAFAQQAAEERRKRELADVTRRPRPASAEAASSSAGPEVASFDEVMAAIPYRTPESQTIAGLKKMRAEGEAIQAAAKAARDAAAPRSGGRLMPAKEDLIGYSWDEDAILNEMLGASDEDYGAHDEEGMVVLTKADIPTNYLKQPPKWLHQPAKTLIGIVRGAIGSLPSRKGKWVLVQEALDYLGELKNVWLGRRYLLSIMAFDNKGRFQIAGTEKDKRSGYVDTALWPLWIAAAHGHSNKIAEEVDDNELATCWYWDQSRAELGNAAAFKGTPIQARDEYPTRLYHRTTRDAALAIVEGELIPGYGRSGKYHNYFAKATLDELGERGGVRANLSFEMVFDTTEVLQHAWLFETSSEGVLCREPVPGSCVLFVRDTSKNVIIWSRPEPEAEEEGEEITVDAPLTSAPPADTEPEFVIPEENDEELVDVAVEAEAPLPAPLSGGQDDVAIEDSTAYDMEEEIPNEPQEAAVEADEADTPMEATEPTVPEMTPGDLALVRGEAAAPTMPPQPVTEFLPLPAPETGGRRRACPGCGFQHFVGQMICLGCGGSIIKASSQQQRKRVKTGRWFQEEAAARATGKRKSDLTVEDVITNMRTEAGGRGLQSLDSAALEKAKQIYKLAERNGFSTIVERFDSDVEYTLASIRQGYDRDFLRIEDVLVHSALPNLGRSQAQRSLGTGTFGSGSGYDRVERMESIARLLYFDEPQGPAALRAGLIEVITDPPLCIMWLGVAYSVRSFVEVFTTHKIVDRIQCFNQVVWIDPSLEYSTDEWVAWIKERISYEVASGRRTYEEKLRQARESREAQARANARNAAWKGGKGDKGAGKGSTSTSSHPYRRY